MVKSGVPLKEFHIVVREVIKEYGYNEYFNNSMHSLEYLFNTSFKDVIIVISDLTMEISINNFKEIDFIIII